MPVSSKTVPPMKPADKLHQDITDRLLEEMDAGVAPWVQPWEAPGAGGLTPMIPYNAYTGQPYHGSNVVILWLATYRAGYCSNAWLPMSHIQALGGRLKVRPGFTPPEGKPWKTGQRPVQCVKVLKRTITDQKTGEDKVIPGGIKAFNVFNLDQIEGLDATKLQILQPPPEHLLRADIAHLIAFQEPKLIHGGDVAAYWPTFDTITMPVTFEDSDDYYATLFHEEIHATGIKKRLDREPHVRRFDKAYCFEELMAELGSAFLCARYGVVGQLQHASYLKHYADALRADRTMFMRAAAAAERAVRFMLDKAKEPPTPYVAEAA